MKKFFATTAIATVAFVNLAHAEGNSTVFETTTFDVAQNLNASELIGMFVYTAENGTGGVTYVDGGAENQEWDNIGDINEIVLNRSGEVESVIVGVGGFLGLGERDVAIDMGALQFVSDGEGQDEFFLVVEASRLDIEQAPEYRAPMPMMDQAEMDMSDDAAMSEGTTMADASTEMENVEQVTSETVVAATEGLQSSSGDRMFNIEDLTAEDLTGVSVFGPNNEDLGEIAELLLGTDGGIDKAVVDVGGFLGLGEYSVALNFDELDITMTGEDDLRVSVPMTQEELEAMPEYTG